MTLEEMKNINPKTVNPDTLVDIATVEVDRSLPRAEQMKQFLEQIKNPYLYKCNGVVVKIAYATTESTIEDRLEQYIRQRSQTKEKI
ncbi:MAG: DUF6870 family protein [Bariatricus sp.]|nr:hypothetical protein [Clostridiales bacterium]